MIVNSIDAGHLQQCFVLLSRYSVRRVPKGGINNEPNRTARAKRLWRLGDADG